LLHSSLPSLKHLFHNAINFRIIGEDEQIFWLFTRLVRVTFGGIMSLVSLGEYEAMSSYLAKYVISVAILFGLIVSFNLVIDPYNYFEIITISKVNEDKVVAKGKRRQVFDRLSDLKPDTLILGTSRSLMGMDAAQFDEAAGFVLNASFERATFGEIYGYFRYALKQHCPKQVILNLDFFSFNAYLESLEEYNEISGLMLGQSQSSIQNKKKLKALTSMDGLIKSIETVRYNLKGQSILQFAERISPLEKFTRVERSLLETNVYFPLPLKKFEFSNSELNIDTFQYLQEIVDTSKANNIDLKLVILPMHARQLLLIKEIGLWEKFEAWKRRLVELAPPFKLYDFAYFMPENMESPHSDKNIQWYDESLHFKMALGEKVLHYIAAHSSDEFGVILSKENLEKSLNKIRLDFQVYQKNYPLDYESVAKTSQLTKRG
jgi:hypothetical protein